MTSSVPKKLPHPTDGTKREEYDEYLVDGNEEPVYVIDEYDGTPFVEANQGDFSERQGPHEYPIEHLENDYGPNGSYDSYGETEVTYDEDVDERYDMHEGREMNEGDEGHDQRYRSNRMRRPQPNWRGGRRRPIYKERGYGRGPPDRGYARQDERSDQQDTLPPDPLKDQRPDYSAMSPPDIARYRADFRIKIGILRNVFPTYGIPEFGEDVDLDVIHTHYDRYVRQIHVNNNVDSYKQYLIIFWLGLELFGVKVLGLDFSGYAMNQHNIMTKYDQYLIELGEKSGGGMGSSWPVEVRILMMAIFNALIFILIKYLSNWVGPGFSGVIQNVVNGLIAGNTTIPPQQSAAPATNTRSGGNGTGIPDPPQPQQGGFDFGSLIANIVPMFTRGMGNNNANGEQQPRARRRPRRSPWRA